MTWQANDQRIDIGGAVTVTIAAGVDRRLARGIARAFEPYHPKEAPPGDGQPADPGVRIEPMLGAPVIRDIENAAGDALVTAFDGERVFVLRGGHACSIPDPIRDDRALFSYTPGFPVGDLIRPYIRPAAAMSALRGGAVVVHASAVALNGRAILIGGWSESGKTEIALALAEAGAEFLSDKWTILRPDGTVCPFPASVGVRRWVLPYLPKLRACLPKAARAQLAAAAVASLISRPVRRPSRNVLLGGAGSLATQLVSMADRAPLTLGRVRSVYGTEADPTTPVTLGMTVLLSTVAPGTTPEAREVGPGMVALRLAQAAAFERRAYFAVSERARYGGAGDEGMDRATVTTMEAGLLEARFAATRVLRVRTPFPGDPRLVVDMILGALVDQ